MIRWAGLWEAFTSDDQYLLGELTWEIGTNFAHPLHGKECRIAGWIPRYEHLIVYVKGDGRYAYVNLIWRRDPSNHLPICKFLRDTDAVNAFIDAWAEGNRDSVTGCSIVPSSPSP
jgi:hypothetical protein